MKQVIRRIEERGEGGKSHPFIQWLKNDAVPARERLSKWLQGAGIFIFGFSDLHKMVLPYPEAEAAADVFKMAINEHADEDSRHWGWYLGDLEKLGLDQEMRFSEALKLLWGKNQESQEDPTYTQRWAIYRLCQLVDRANGDPLLRYCVIKSIEAYGSIIFRTTAEVSHQFAKETGIRLDYLGDIHADKEDGGLQHDESGIETRIFSIELDGPKRTLANEIAEEACNVIEKRWDEFYGWVTSS